ncbi:helix-turn-helix domain-containing protein [Saccharopolyspora griseoalba]|uniref:Helix-turn-helix domain-containing protein n=1 Tax=Saccharopolyspora griseoalba TaxID=1431848 RepID=A0ABW2LNE6_9PSEU
MFRGRRVFQVGLGAELRRLRELSGLSTRSVAAKLGTSPAWVSRTETGARKPTAAEVKELCVLYGVTGEPKDKLVAKASDDGGTVPIPADEYADQLANVMTLEREASRITDFGISLIPGLLQTPSYARAVLSGVSVPMRDMELSVSTRIGRQCLLTRPNGPGTRFFVDEFALRRRIGGAQVMRGQLKHLHACAELPKVTVRVVPVEAGAYPGLEGPFAVYEFEAISPYVYIENQKGGIFLTKADETCEYLDVCEQLQALALDAVGSAKLIERIAKELDH